MPSSQKTPNLFLNKWTGVDKPKRSDWIADNEKLDSAYASLVQAANLHQKDMNLHVTATEKALIGKGGQNFAITSYVGDGKSSRQIVLGKKPEFAILFTVGKPPVSYYPYTKCLSGYMSAKGCSDGIVLNSNGFTVYNSLVADPSGYLVCLNENALTYICVYW